jgi:hypothetical protein
MWAVGQLSGFSQRGSALTATVPLFGPLVFFFSMNRLGGSIVIDGFDLFRWYRGGARGNTRGGLFVTTATATARHDQTSRLGWYLRYQTREGALSYVKKPSSQGTTITRLRSQPSLRSGPPG